MTSSFCIWRHLFWKIVFGPFFKYESRILFQETVISIKSFHDSWSENISASKLVNQTYLYVVGLTLTRSGSLVDSNLLAIVTLWPKRQYLGIFFPTTPASTMPVWIPILICKKNWSLYWSIILLLVMESKLKRELTLIGLPSWVVCWVQVWIIFKAIHAICCAWKFVSLCKPQATQYASPIVSTWKHKLFN